MGSAAPLRAVVRRAARAGPHVGPSRFPRRPDHGEGGDLAGGRHRTAPVRGPRVPGREAAGAVGRGGTGLRPVLRWPTDLQPGERRRPGARPLRQLPLQGRAIRGVGGVLEVGQAALPRRHRRLRGHVFRLRTALQARDRRPAPARWRPGLGHGRVRRGHRARRAGARRLPDVHEPRIGDGRTVHQGPQGICRCRPRDEVRRARQRRRPRDRERGVGTLRMAAVPDVTGVGARHGRPQPHQLRLPTSRGSDIGGSSGAGPDRRAARRATAHPRRTRVRAQHGRRADHVDRRGAAVRRGRQGHGQLSGRQCGPGCGPHPRHERESGHRHLDPVGVATDRRGEVRRGPAVPASRCHHDTRRERLPCPIPQ